MDIRYGNESVDHIATHHGGEGAGCVAERGEPQRGAV